MNEILIYGIKTRLSGTNSLFYHGTLSWTSRGPIMSAFMGSTIGQGWIKCCTSFVYVQNLSQTSHADCHRTRGVGRS